MTSREYRFLSSISRHVGALPAVGFSKKEIHTISLLIDRGYVIRTGALNLAQYELTDIGHVALADYHVERKRHILEIVRYGITTAIAIAALIISIISLSKE